MFVFATEPLKNDVAAKSFAIPGGMGTNERRARTKPLEIVNTHEFAWFEARREGMAISFFG